jgi:hypothetical protein
MPKPFLLQFTLIIPNSRSTGTYLERSAPTVNQGGFTPFRPITSSDATDGSSNRNYLPQDSMQSPMYRQCQEFTAAVTEGLHGYIRLAAMQSYNYDYRFLSSIDGQSSGTGAAIADCVAAQNGKFNNLAGSKVATMYD